MHQDQPFDVGGIFVNGIDVKSPGLVVVNEVQNEETTYTLRADVWILAEIGMGKRTSQMLNFTYRF
ncbi:MAG: hypothetical protein QNK22_00545 [Xanthomonadales bacterium]|nr:hypothetical protein [Xanthomonadales bacterium]